MYLSRNYIIQIIFILAGFTFIIKLFFIQVVNTEYSIAAEKNIVQRIEECPYRGIIYDRNKQLLVYNNPVYDLMVIPKAVKNLEILSFCQAFNISTSEFTNALNRAKRYSHIRPSVFIKNIDHNDFAAIHTKLSDYLGFYIRARTVRKYPQAILANTLGYVGEINIAQLLADTSQYYKQGDLIGISGLEAKYETLLRGKRGVKYKITDARGQEKGAFKEGTLDILSVPGQDLISTIDVSLQLYGETLMKNKIGSIVAIEPTTGEVLAIVSSPSYDPNLLTSKNLSNNFAALERDSFAPLFHRPIMAMYPPGSIFKLVQALIALQEEVVQPSMVYSCNKKIVNCHSHPSPTNLHQAIQFSCNPYFYHVFKSIVNQHIVKDTYEDTRIGLNKWLNYVRQFGLGKQLGIDLPHEKSGYLPDVSFYDARYGAKRWKASTIRSLDIGQGEMLVTPLQMANLAAIMANRGHYYTPHLIKTIEGQTISAEKHVIQIEKKHFDFAVNAMRDVIDSSTAWRAKIKNVVVCGKTGTVENPHGEDHAVFMGFAPLETPKIAIAVYVENAGWGARAAAAIAGLMLEKYLMGQVTRKSIEDYVLKGDFTH
ncbi:hypothetical protein Aasi_0246 [Candidatus Amoebophilus asiaticus 5a2]|uniref:Penicillin-binding protein 2 n=1 Tax=Amoebophilus asiaticus (strain 5a2) TaxID=452471 RepID=B3ER37_AMOA5|nr:penicillin-binding transpeptidase domain-containing protein [Candidatus Amoebophilus asiaticus]ACE05689.1 hypothetical protein Aasi_0246 [Candidatus Amoebophilus asiaticus 5a2]